MIRATRIGLRLKTSNLQIRSVISGGARCLMHFARLFPYFLLGFTSASTEMWFEVRFFMGVSRKKERDAKDMMRQIGSAEICRQKQKAENAKRGVTCVNRLRILYKKTTTRFQ